MQLSVFLYLFLSIFVWPWDTTEAPLCLWDRCIASVFIHLKQYDILQGSTLARFISKSIAYALIVSRHQQSCKMVPRCKNFSFFCIFKISLLHCMTSQTDLNMQLILPDDIDKVSKLCMRISEVWKLFWNSVMNRKSFFEIHLNRRWNALKLVHWSYLRKMRRWRRTQHFKKEVHFV